MMVAQFLKGQVGWKMPSSAEILSDPEDKKWWDENHSGECPAFAAAHFSSPRVSSYAVILVRRRGRDFEGRVMLLEANARPRELSPGYKIESPIVVFSGRSKEACDFYTSKCVRMRNESFVVSALEAWGFEFYRRGSQIRSVQIDD